MRNYVIINGVNSLTIQGLAINTLPPITKPMIRTQREEIDGRDGDIVTELGYSAYDKQIEIGLWGTYDINDIIKYFTGEGTIVFSNEDDKYYNFKILDQIDYQKLLKFKTATITLHCQPFKYPLEEEPVEAEITTLTGTGETLTLNNTEEAPMSLVYKGNTSQNGTPTPDSPIPIQVVSGDNSIVVCGKNLFNKATTTTGKIVSRADGTLSNSNTYSASDYIPMAENTTYTLDGGDTSTSSFNRWYSACYDKDKNYIGYVSNADTFTTIPNTRYMRFTVYTDKLDTALLVKGNTLGTYEAYTGESYPISLGDIELLKIGTYQDKIDKSSGKNLFNIQSIVKGRLDSGVIGYESATTSLTLNDTSFSFTTNATWRGVSTEDYIEVKPSTDYVLKIATTSTTGVVMACYDENKTWLSNATQTTVETGITKFTTLASTKYARISIQLSTTGTCNIDIPQLTESSTALEYEPYGTGWYVKKEIGKVVLDGSEEGWSYPSTNRFNLDSSFNDYFKSKDNITYLSNYYEAFGQTNDNGGFNTLTTNTNYGFNLSSTSTNYYTIRFKDTRYTSTADFKTWLSTHNTTIYYVLNTPTYTLIEDSTLIEELESMKKSYEGQTNISQENNDMPFELDVSVTFLTPMEINNIGNIYAKPILTIEGTGNIGVVLNDIQILDIDLTNNGKIAIDVTKLEAYNPDDDTLLNRLVTGDYMKLLINEGENTITFTGNVSGATLTNYVRWI